MVTIPIFTSIKAMRSFSTIFLLLIGLSVIGQSNIVVVSYNVENLFDALTDSTSNYTEFNPGEKKDWNEFRLRAKVNAIAKTLTACHDSMPHFVGLMEIENRSVLEQLCKHPLLAKEKYEIIHFDSPDHRGIDVAFLFKRDRFNLLNMRAFKADFSEQTRDQLWVRGILNQTQDTLNFFINHWPSRYGGKRASEKNRLAAAKQLKTEIDSIGYLNPNEYLIALGDFNDNPGDTSIRYLTSSPKYWNAFQDSTFEIGSLKYRKNWQLFDQFILSQNLKTSKGLSFKSVQIFQSEHLLEEDATYGGWKPHRTYQGPIHRGGPSDHLPVVLVLEKKP